MNLCWFIGGYFYTFSKVFSSKLNKPQIVPRDENESKLISLFINGNDLNLLLDEPYDFELVLSQFFIPILLKFQLFDFLKDFSKHLFNFPFLPKRIFKDPELQNYFETYFKPNFKRFSGEKFGKVILKDSFKFVLEKNHVSTFFIKDSKMFELRFFENSEQK